MSKIPFKCPSCGHDLTIHSGTEISDVDDITCTTCSRCGSIIHKDDIIRQAHEHTAILVRNILGNHLR